MVDTTTIREIVQQFHEDDVRDRQATLLRGVTVLEADMTVSETGMEDGDEISLVWSDPFVEMASWTGGEMDQQLYVRIPSHITCISGGAFYDCTALLKVVIPNSVTSIGERAFDGCSCLTEVEIPPVTSIEYGVFRGCGSLKHVDLPDSVTTIGFMAFYFCNSLTQVKTPKSLTHIGDEAFAAVLS